MSSTVWECPVLSFVSLHLVKSVAPCHYVAGHYSGAWQAAHSAGAMLQSHCSYLYDGAVCPELLNHYVLYQTTMSVLHICAVLSQACNPLARTSCRHRPCRIVP
jgi:hypothetical protein